MRRRRLLGLRQVHRLLVARRAALSSPPSPRTLVPASTTRPRIRPTTRPDADESDEAGHDRVPLVGSVGQLLGHVGHLPRACRHCLLSGLEQPRSGSRGRSTSRTFEVGVELDQARPQCGALVGVGGAGADRTYALLADPDGGVRVGDQVGVPLRVLRQPALRGDDDEVGTVLEVEQRRGERRPGLAADVVEQQRRHRLAEARADPPLRADPAVGQLKTRTWARAMYLMTFTVIGESRPSGFSSGSPKPTASEPRFQTTSSCSLRLRQPSGVRTIVWW